VHAAKASFEQASADSGDPKIAQYKVKTIPRLVFLDSSNNDLYNGQSWQSQEDLAALVKNLR
jgi:hypothetical protein